MCVQLALTLGQRGYSRMSRRDNFLARLVKSIATIVAIFHGKRTALSALRPRRRATWACHTLQGGGRRILQRS
jgi:hypothetical protein